MDRVLFCYVIRTIVVTVFGTWVPFYRNGDHIHASPKPLIRITATLSDDPIFRAWNLHRNKSYSLGLYNRMSGFDMH